MSSFHSHQPLIGAMLLAAALLAASVDAQAWTTGAEKALSAEPVWTYNPDWTVEHADVADLNADGILDIIIGEQNTTYYGEPHRVVALNGASGDTLWTYLLQDAVRSMTIGDLNNDGVMDVVAGASYNGSGIPDGDVHAINGENGASLWIYPVNATISCVTVGNFNGDPYLDVAAGSFDDNVHAINGFTGANLWTATIGSLWINDVAAADVNGDGIDDVAYAHEYLADYTNHCGVLNGANGATLWDQPVTYIPTSCLFGDFDNDGTLDLAFGAVDGADQGLLIVRVAETGEFFWSATLYTVDHSNGLVTLFSHDLDDDGDQDIVVGCHLGVYQVYAFNGNNSVPMFTSELLEGYPEKMTFGDVTGDGQLDIVCATYDRVQVVGADDGKHLWYYSVAGSIEDVAVADIDNNGILDVIAVGGASYSGTPPNPLNGVWALRTIESPLLWEHVLNQYGNELTIANLNQDDYMDVAAVFSLGDYVKAFSGLNGAELWTWQGSENLYTITSGDFDNDGQSDIAVAGADDMVTTLHGATGAILWQFTQPTNQFYRKCLAAADLNGDGAADIIAGCDNGYVYALDGPTGDTLWTHSGLGAINEVELAQMNDLGPLDVVVVTSAGKMAVLDGEGGGTLWDYTTPGAAEHVEVLDYDGDKVPDVAIAIAPSAAKVIMVNGGTHLEAWNRTLGVASNSHSMAHGDLDGDELDDLVIPGNSTSKSVIALSGLNGADLWPAFATGGEVNCVWVQDMDGDFTNDVVAGSDDQFVYVLNGATGLEYWSYATSGDVMHVMVGDIAGPGKPSIAAVTFEGDGTVYAFDSFYEGPPPGCCNLRGDANDDAAINVGDITYLVAYIFRGGPAPACLDEGDLNVDTQLNVADLTFLIAYVFKSGPPPSPC